MSKILFRLNGVSDDEAEEVRQLLINNDIDFYETSPGNWGVSMPAIWLREDGQYHQARALLDEYQKERSIRVRAEYECLKKEGKHKTFVDAVRAHPVQFIVHLTLALLVIYLSAKLVIDLGS